jgi:hypothetical protein
MLQMMSEGIWLAEIPPAWGQPLVLVNLSSDWMRPTSSNEGQFHYSKYTALNVSLIQKHPHRNIQKKYLIKYLGSSTANVTHKINYNSL